MSSQIKRKPKNRHDNGSLPAKILAFRNGKNPEADTVGHLFASANYLAMPFHHLIPAARLGFNSSFLHNYFSTYELDKSTAGKHFFWQSLAGCGTSAREAALFSDSIECSFIELAGGHHLIQVDWEVLHYDSFSGCAELYLAEIFLCKQRVYNAGDEIPNSLEFTTDEITERLPENIFSPFIENIAKLFLRSLSANYTLTVSQIDFDLIGSQKRRKPVFLSDLFKSHLTETASRVKGSKEPAITHKQKGIYKVILADYWTRWQRAAQSVKFDFAFLHTLNDARAVRFYELTKLRRVPNNRTDIQTVSQVSISQKLEIEYGMLAALMPLPRLTDEREIKQQINDLIKPLRSAGYVKSFALKADEQNGSSRRARLVFRFND